MDTWIAALKKSFEAFMAEEGINRSNIKDKINEDTLKKFLEKFAGSADPAELTRQLASAPGVVGFFFAFMLAMPLEGRLAAILVLAEVMQAVGLPIAPAVRTAAVAAFGAMGGTGLTDADMRKARDRMIASIMGSPVVAAPPPPAPAPTVPPAANPLPPAPTTGAPASPSPGEKIMTMTESQLESLELLEEILAVRKLDLIDHPKDYSEFRWCLDWCLRNQATNRDLFDDFLPEITDDEYNAVMDALEVIKNEKSTPDQVTAATKAVKTVLDRYDTMVAGKKTMTYSTFNFAVRGAARPHMPVGDWLKFNVQDQFDDWNTAERRRWFKSARYLHVLMGISALGAILAVLFFVALPALVIWLGTNLIVRPASWAWNSFQTWKDKEIPEKGPDGKEQKDDHGNVITKKRPLGFVLGMPLFWTFALLGVAAIGYVLVTEAYILQVKDAHGQMVTNPLGYAFMIIAFGCIGTWGMRFPALAGDTWVPKKEEAEKKAAAEKAAEKTPEHAAVAEAHPPEPAKPAAPDAAKKHDAKKGQGHDDHAPATGTAAVDKALLETPKKFMTAVPGDYRAGILRVTMGATILGALFTFIGIGMKSVVPGLGFVIICLFAAGFFLDAGQYWTFHIDFEWMQNFLREKVFKHALKPILGFAFAGILILLGLSSEGQKAVVPTVHDQTDKWLGVNKPEITEPAPASSSKSCDKRDEMNELMAGMEGDRLYCDVHPTIGQCRCE